MNEILRCGTARNITAPDLNLDFVVTLTNFSFEAAIGVNQSEIGRLQTLIIDVEIAILPLHTDQLDETIDYVFIASAARRLGEKHINLVETFAHRLASEFIAHPRVNAVSVALRKPEAVTGGLAGTRVSISKRNYLSRHLARYEE